LRRHSDIYVAVTAMIMAAVGGPSGGREGAGGQPSLSAGRVAATIAR